MYSLPVQGPYSRDDKCVNSTLAMALGQALADRLIEPLIYLFRLI